jgi:outer membrane receptor protein involved in Fe transport
MPTGKPACWRCLCVLLGVVFAGGLGAWAEDDPLASKPTVLGDVVVTPSVQTDAGLGASIYTLSSDQIETVAQGPDSTFNRVLLRAPGVSQDSAGQVHFREEDPYYQYYIDGVLLPRDINGFGQDVDTHFADSVSLEVGALPAQFAFGNYGVISVQSRTGAGLQGDGISVYGGSHDTFEPSFSAGGSSGGTDYFVGGSYLHDSLGIENPTPGARAVHDDTDQYKAFSYFSRKLSEESSVSFILSASHADFQIPNNPAQAPVLEFPGGFPAAKSSLLDETQTEQSYYGILSFKQALGDLSYQVALVNRYSSVLFRPDENGDLYFNGVASRVFRDILTDGVQADFTLGEGDAGTLRGGILFDTEAVRDHNAVAVFSTGNVDSASGEVIAEGPPFGIEDDHERQGYDGTLYLQDEWKASSSLTFNFGGRFDLVDAYVDESQVSPRISAVYQASPDTILHAGYARYFIPPPLENVSPTSVGKFDGTTNAADQDTDDPVKCERSNYFDAGVTHNLSPEIAVGLDVYYKQATDQIDDGQFGAANITAPYNYANARIYGGELSASYENGGFSAYGNLAVAQDWATHIVSSEFEFDSDELAYIDSHNIHIDQTQFVTGSTGASYSRGRMTAPLNALYGSGMRRGFANEETLPPYATVDLGIELRFKFGVSGRGTLRFDATNLLDRSYELNDGTGIGVGASRYGARRGLFSGVSCYF